MEKGGFNPAKYKYKSLPRFNQTEELKESYLTTDYPLAYRRFNKFVPKIKQKNEMTEMQKLTRRMSEMEARLKVVEEQTIHIDGYKPLNDDEALVEVETFLRGLRESGAPNFTVLDIIANLNIAPDQVDRVLNIMRRRKQ